MPNQVIYVEHVASIQFERSAHDFNSRHWQLLYSQILRRSAVVTAVRPIGVLNGVSLPVASLLTQAVAIPRVETMRAPRTYMYIKAMHYADLST